MLPGQPRPTAWRYPLPRDRKSYFGASLKRGKGQFQGREDVLTALKQAIESCSSSENNKIIALSGIGGAGKTEILLEYGYRARQANHIFFCQAVSGESFQMAMYRLASAVGSEALSQRVGLADRETTWVRYNQEERVRAFISWLEDSPMGSSIVLFDDVDAFQQAQDLEKLSTAMRSWPHTVLLTTRDPHLGSTLADDTHKDSVPYVIDALTEETLEPIMRQYITEGLTFSQAELRSISQVVDGHVMAACRAVQFICQELSLSVGEDPVGQFIKSFGDDESDHNIRGEFLNFRPHPGRSLADCFETSITRLGELEYQASRILNFAAYLMVPGLNFRDFFQHPRPWLSMIPPSEHLRTREIFELSRTDFGRALRKLAATSAIVRTEEGSLIIPRMMQEYLLHRQRHGGRINILRQIILLAQASIQLDEKREVFEQYVANCRRIARKFQIDVADTDPSPAVLKMIAKSGTVHMLRSHARTLSEQKIVALQASASQELRQQYYDEVWKLWFKCKKAGMLSSPNAGSTKSASSDARIGLYEDLSDVVREINLNALETLEQLKREYSRGDDVEPGADTVPTD